MIDYNTMQDGELLISRLVDFARTAHPHSTVSTWTGEGVREIDFPTLSADASRLANALAGLGVGVHGCVGTFMWNNAEHAVVYGAVPSMGAVLHTINLRLSADQAVYSINSAQDIVLIIDASLGPLVSSYLPRTPTIEHVVVANGPVDSVQVPAGVTVHSFADLLTGQPDTYRWPAIDERSPAVVCYTSGTTGDPKGVVYSHRSIWLHSMAICQPNAMNLSDRDSALAIVPMFHVMSWGLPYAAMISGMSLVMPDRFLQPEPLLRLMAKTRPTFAAAVPTIWQAVMVQLESAPQDISHLREVLVGGATVSPNIIRKFDEDFGVAIVHAWGMTETSPMGAVARAPRNVTDPDEIFAYRCTQGKFSALVEARLTREDGAIVPHDGVSAGELEVRGPWVAGSYFSRDDGANINDGKFRDGWLRTGDVGTISGDGYLTIVDRTKDLIKTGGEWISSVDLENKIMSHHGIREAAVIGVPDEQWDERPFVLFVARDTGTDAQALRRHLVDLVPKWQLPEKWAVADEIPKTSVGKFDKKLIRESYRSSEYAVIDVRG
ncbi:long-chain fatty acid--CoA ligase [Gordonia sp. CPCC 205333]|uniref:long-chain fatty acid--CoA ligase n=1 Tax=Gordonia sp. CPCC 205333 TaxID=3140790 RepID=UPI003AF388B0